MGAHAQQQVSFAADPSAEASKLEHVDSVKRSIMAATGFVGIAAMARNKLQSSTSDKMVGRDVQGSALPELKETCGGVLMVFGGIGMMLTSIGDSGIIFFFSCVVALFGALLTKETSSG